MVIVTQLNNKARQIVSGWVFLNLLMENHLDSHNVSALGNHWFQFSSWQIQRIKKHYESTYLCSTTLANWKETHSEI